MRHRFFFCGGAGAVLPPQIGVMRPSLARGVSPDALSPNLFPLPPLFFCARTRSPFFLDLLPPLPPRWTLTFQQIISTFTRSNFSFQELAALPLGFPLLFAGFLCPVFFFPSPSKPLTADSALGSLLSPRSNVPSFALYLMPFILSTGHSSPRESVNFFFFPFPLGQTFKRVQSFPFPPWLIQELVFFKVFFFPR